MFETLDFYVGKEMPFELLTRRLVEFKYARHDRVSGPGEFSLRGGVLDVYPVYFSFPVRLEFSDETVESIYTFDLETGLRLESHQMVVVMPSRGARGARHATPVLSLDYESPVDPFVDIEPGDLVVHILHGIARYRGVQSLKNKQHKAEGHFSLEFADKNMLYVPTRDLHLIQRYVAFGKIRPKLSRLGSKTWERLKEKTRKGVFSFASELLEMQAKRRALQGHAFPKDTEWQKMLEEDFQFQETADQLRAAGEVKADMESPNPMDRLICGDVGYGKTEVALRAAFKAVMSGKQTAILVPTTLLAEQHTETFKERMKNFPVEIRMLSRFQSKGEQSNVVQEVADGSCDIVIGTHRLLSKDIAFKDLGLVIIDEEQRFGVKHKEHLKKLRLLVDVLTLSATPIPRTLYQSLVGTRDMSTIQTPPKDRKPIETRVTEFSEEAIRQAIRQELEREGQVFFIHNRVQGIEKMAKRIAELAPAARIGVGHGQMPAKALEAVMKKFIHGEIDVLVSTTIVESGIDIPNANTLIVNRADAFGLSELYQLRGRVGRFDRNAYAYLLIPKGSALTEESQKRLSAIEKFTHLGAGFGLAMEDLEIRGAGNILGTEQHGYVVNVGFDLYCRILKETVNRLKQKE
jgi:transcription-repair coupling factor (superfamily II helicase)